MDRKVAILTEITDIIAYLKEAKGSAFDKILDHLVALRKTPLRNAAFQVKKAIKTGLKTGLIKEVSGRFKLGLAPRAYAIFRCYQTESAGLSLPVKEHRSRKGKRSKSKSRRDKRRRRSNFYSLGMEDEESDDDYNRCRNYKNGSKFKSLPVKKFSRRRGKKRSKSRRRQGRRRRGTDYVDSEDLAMSTDESGSKPMDKGRRRKGRSRRRKGRKSRGRRRNFGPKDDVDSMTSTDSKEVSGNSSDEKPKTTERQGREDTGLGISDPEKRENDPPSRTQNVISSHYIN